MIFACFRKEIVLAGFSAEAQVPMVMVDETELSPAVCAAVLQLGHETLHRLKADGITRPARAAGGQAFAPRLALTLYGTAAPEACFAPPILCYFRPTD